MNAEQLIIETISKRIKEQKQGFIKDRDDLRFKIAILDAKINLLIELENAIDANVPKISVEQDMLAALRE